MTKSSTRSSNRSNCTRDISSSSRRTGPSGGSTTHGRGSCGEASNICRFKESRLTVSTSLQRKWMGHRHDHYHMMLTAATVNAWWELIQSVEGHVRNTTISPWQEAEAISRGYLADRDGKIGDDACARAIESMGQRVLDHIARLPPAEGDKARLLAAIRQVCMQVPGSVAPSPRWSRRLQRRCPPSTVPPARAATSAAGWPQFFDAVGDGAGGFA